MHCPAEAVDRRIPCRDLTGTVIRIVCIISVLPHESKRSHNLKGRSRCIGSLCRSVQKRTVFFICIQRRPVTHDIIRVIVRFGDHGQDLSRIRFHHNDSTPVVAERIVGRLLQISIQRRYHSISHVFRTAELILKLFKEESVGGEQLKVFY